MQAGAFRHRIAIQSRVSSQDDTTGVITETWAHFATVWANYRPSSVREFVAAGIEGSKITAAFTIRYLSGVLPSMRIVFGEHVYNIEGVLEDYKTGLDWITLPVSEVVNG